MPGIPSSAFLRQLRNMVGIPEYLETPDGLLLESFIAERDEAAFDCLLKRHAPMVYGACLRIVRDQHLAEDAFQATILVLCRKASSIRRQQSFAGWLYQVATRIALRLRADASRQIASSHSMPDVSVPATPPALDSEDIRAALDEVMLELPDKYRVPLILHYLEGKPAVVVASELGWPYGTVLVRLARGRDKLRALCERRGLTPGAQAIWITELARMFGQGTLPAGLSKSTTKLAVLLAIGRGAAPSLVAPKVAELAEGMRRTMMFAKIKMGASLLAVAVGLAAATMLGFSYQTAAQTSEPSAQNQISTKQPPVQAKTKTDDKKYQLTGTVRLEKTGEPVAGATLGIMTGEGGKEAMAPMVTAKSGEDGVCVLELGAGHYQEWYLLPPAGYWTPRWPKEAIALTPATPVVRHNYLVRRGTRWNFRVSPGVIADGWYRSHFCRRRKGSRRSISERPDRGRTHLPDLANGGRPSLRKPSRGHAQ